MIRRDDRGVSDLVGFVLIFSVIIGSAAVIFTVGLGTLDDYKAGVQTQNAEGTMRSVDDALVAIESGRSPHRTVQMRLHDGRLRLSNESDTAINVTVSTPDGTSTTGFSPGTLAYRLDGSTVAYQGGAVFRADGESAVAVDGPGFRCDEGSVAIVSVVSLRASGSTQRSGSVTTVEFERDRTTLHVPTGGSPVVDAGEEATVEVTVRSDYDAAWERPMTEAGWSTPSPNTYTCDATRVVVRETVVDVGLGS
ncbi:hypothetical protein ACFQE1_11110 [Halobium palmae]|uniref:Flagellin n=1 Tax=Halobium palmae TaxID=1776492 RepID=A0ABD5S073_9EURY